MAINYPGPFEVRLFYTTNEPAGVNEHVLRLSCGMAVEGEPGDPFTAWIPNGRSGSSTVDLAGHVDALLAVLRPLFNTSVDFSYAELWEYSVGTFDAVYRASYDVNLNGTNAAATVNFSQTVFSFRSALGGVMKVDLRGTPYSPGPQLSFPTPTSVVNIFAGYILSPSTPWWARDNSFPVAAIRFLPGQNERAFRRINR